MKFCTNFILAMLFFLVLLCASSAAERWVCPATTTRLEAYPPLDSAIKISILFGGQPAIDTLGFTLFFPDYRIVYYGLERSQITKDWQTLIGGSIAPGLVHITGFHTEAIPAAVADTLCHVWFMVISGTEWWLFTSNFTEDLQGTSSCGMDVINNKQTTWGLIKGLFQK